MSPQSLAGLGGQGSGSQPQSAGDSFPQYDANGNPLNPAAQAAAATQEAAGTALMQIGGGQKTKDDFNFSQDSPGNGFYQGNPKNDAPAGSPARNGTIANNSGGAIPGGGGGAPPANLGASNKGARGPASAGANVADVMQGFQPGGYSSSGGPGPTGVDGDEGNPGYQRTGSGNGGMGFHNGQDLKKYLPGGTLDPNRYRGVAGLRANGQINGPFVNMWEKISDRFQEKCRLGQLLGCG